METSVPAILRLPLESIHELVICFRPQELAAFALTCKSFYSAIYGSDQYIWRELFLQLFDDPRPCLLDIQSDNITNKGARLCDIDYDFKGAYQGRIRATRTLRNATASHQERKAMLTAILSVLRTAAPVPYDSKNGTWVEEVLQSSGAWNHKIWPLEVRNGDREAPDIMELDLIAQLHLRIGLTDAEVETVVEDYDSDNWADSGDEDEVSILGHRFGESNARSNASRIVSILPGSRAATTRPSPNIRTQARVGTYDLSKYTANNTYAPFISLPSGGYRPNYRHLELLMVDLLWNLRDDLPITSRLPDETDKEMTQRCSPPMGLDALRPYSAPGWKEQFEAKRIWEEARDRGGDVPVPLRDNRPNTEWEPWEDWAGVEGIWYRVFSFMDYHELARFNLPTFFPIAIAAAGRSQPVVDVSVFEEEGFTEVTRLLSTQVRITSIDRSTSAIRPRIYFEGRSPWPSEGGPQQDRSLWIGWVEPLSPGSEEIRWRTVTHIAGQARWVCEHIQVGGVGSARGMLGNWTGVDHNAQDPVGPTWSWKVAGREALDPISSRR